MINSPGGTSLKLKDSCLQSGFIEEPSYQDYHQQQQQHPLAAGTFPQQFHPKDKSLQTSANCSTPQQQLLSAPQHLPSPNNNYSFPSSQCSDQEPDHQSSGVPSGNISYEEFIAAEEPQSSSIDPKTGFPNTWPKVTSFPANVASTPVEQPSPAKVLPPLAPKASPSNVPRTFPPPSSPSPSRCCSCCIIL